VNTFHEWDLQLSKLCGFVVPKEGIVSCYGIHRIYIGIMVIYGVAHAESMAFTCHKIVEVHTVYQEANKATHKKRILAQRAKKAD
jgi:hypothetical protein